MQLEEYKNWDKKAQSGAWGPLDNMYEACRYGVIAAYCRKLLKKQSVLDVACGEGVLVQFLPKESVSRYVGADISASALARARKKYKNLKFYRRSLEALEIPEKKKFDAVICSEALFFCTDLSKATASFRKLMAPNGHLIISMCEKIDEEHDRIVRKVWGHLKKEWTQVREVVVQNTDSKIRWRIGLFKKQ